MRRIRHAKIVATLGPASSDRATIRALFEAGADVFRLNFSHGSHEDHRQRYEMIRDIERETGRPISVLLDLQGPKLRLGSFAAGRVTLRPGAAFRLDLDAAPGDDQRVGLPHPEVFQALAPGVELLLDDGKVRLVVEECSPDQAATRVVVPGPLSDRKGVSVVGAVLPLSALTDKDRRDLTFGLDLGADWIALSFVQRPEDIEEVRALAQGRAPIMAKLEKPAAIDCLEEIVALSDAIMVARGDLGVELPPERVPIIQRRILRACRGAGKPVVVATQMLESMITAPTPTRAEASDVATAIYDGADAVMLSAESAAGQYPVAAVRMMDRIIREVERDPHYRLMVDAARPDPEATVSGVICSALSRAASILPLAATATYTMSGATTLRAARERPASPILALTPSVATARRLALVWGVHPVVSDLTGRVAVIVEQACQAATREGVAQAGDILAVTAGIPFGETGTTNLLRIAQIEGDADATSDASSPAARDQSAPTPVPV